MQPRCRRVAWRSYHGAELCPGLGLPMPTYSGKSRARRTRKAMQVPRTYACSSRFHGLREYVMIKGSRAVEQDQRRRDRPAVMCHSRGARTNVSTAANRSGWLHPKTDNMPYPAPATGTMRDWLIKPTQPYIGECGRTAACRSSSAIVAAGLVELTEPVTGAGFRAHGPCTASAGCTWRHASFAHVAPRVDRTRFVLWDSGPG